MPTTDMTLLSNKCFVKKYREKNLQLSRDSLLFRGPVVGKTGRECENIYTFKRVLKTPTNKAALEKVYLIRGTWMNYNKGLVIFVYF